MKTTDEFKHSLLRIRQVFSLIDESIQCLLSDQNIDKILYKMPYSEQMLDSVIPINRSLELHVRLASEIMSSLYNIAPQSVLALASTVSAFIVLKDGAKHTVDLSTMECDCSYSTYKLGACHVAGMCCHLAKVIHALDRPEYKELFADEYGLIQRHVQVNTSSEIGRYEKVAKFSVSGATFTIYNANRQFYYITIDDKGYAYSQVDRMWCIAPEIPPTHIRYDVEAKIIELLLGVEVSKPDKIVGSKISERFGGKGIDAHFYNDNHQCSLIYLEVLFGIKKVSTHKVFFTVGADSYELKYNKAKCQFTQKCLQNFPEVFKMWHLPMLISWLEEAISHYFEG